MRSRRRTGRAAIALVVVLALLAAACSGDDDASGEPATSTTTTVAATAGTVPSEECDPGDPASVETAPVEGVPSDLTVTSFDGTAIRAHWFPTDGAGDEPAPT